MWKEPTASGKKKITGNRSMEDCGGCAGAQAADGSTAVIPGGLPRTVVRAPEPNFYVAAK